MAYIPSDQVDTLSLNLLNPNSALYTNGNPSVVTLMSMIDPSIPILPGSSMAAGGTPVSSSNSAATTSDTGTTNDGSPGSSSTSSNSPVRPSSVGIAVGAVAGAAVYGAAMFLVARRYKKRKSGHQRSSSAQSTRGPRPGEQSNLMVTGARGSYGTRFGGRTSRNSDRSGNSGRTGRTYISPPVMAENSLGWN
ncbi:multicopy suppressor of a budding defect [Elasticomyces elasticus]|nr:multicopy suppressor of a budding defect [Elasticomyces elasticus]KAK5024404.1 multicopy suppressor of a budding defect [Exophiala sideris]KAK5030914.1 multicopy suppressor of a budding defect [Exophiala sideris]KAK5054137.1 multicopy suppressor of a budding defect [Exophiala sideris]KAK5179507.1 multicopy suppressor of a budding defect [Eurotiomycetes sp. CCFEE 6388]